MSEPAAAAAATAVGADSAAGVGVQPQPQPQASEQNGAHAVRLHIGGVEEAAPEPAAASGEKPAQARGGSNGSVTPVPADPANANGAAADAPARAKGLVRQASSGASSAAYTSGTAAPAPPAESPEVRAGWLSRLFFLWLNPIIDRGAKTALMEEDMYAVTPTVEASGLSAEFEAEWAIELARAEDPPHPKHGVYKPSVKSVLYRLFKVQFWLGGFCKVIMDALQFLQPILLEWILAFIFESQTRAPDDRPPAWEGYVLAVAIGLNPFITTVLSNLYFRLMMTIGLRARTILVTQLYKKSLRLSPAARQNMSVGQIVNMMSTDASKVDLFAGYIHFLWSAIGQVSVAIALLIRAIGPPALAGLGVILIMFPIQGFVMAHLQALRKATVKYTDRRIKLMNEILQGIRVIKVYAWENSFMAKLTAIRAEEMRFVRKARFTNAWNSTIMQTGPLLMGLLAFIVLGLTTSSFSPQKIFSALTLFNLLRMPLLLFPMTLAFWSDANIGLQRIQGFLLAEELSSEPELVHTDAFAIKVSGADFAWEKTAAEKDTKHESTRQAAKGEAASPKAQASLAAEAKEQEPGAAPEVVAPFHLDGINMVVPKGSLTIIVGAVGSGKSSLLAGILGEMKRTAGQVQISGSVGFCPQQAWIQNATLKDNVLFGLPFDGAKYDDAVKTCCLTADIEVLPAKDATEIGEKGINLSGGQKARVNLARAVYFDSDIILLDDPLSAVDAHVSKALFNGCICDKLRDKTRILVTHQLQYVSSCDQVIFVENGRIAETGTYTQLMREKGNFFKLMSTYVGEEDDEQEGEDGAGAEGEGAAETGASSAKIRNRGLKSARKSSGGDKAGETGTVAVKKLDKEAKRKQAEAAKVAASLMQAEERTKGGVPWSVYSYYIRHCGGALLVFLALMFMCLQTANSTWVTWWLGLWSDNEYNQSNNWYLGIYAALGMGQLMWALMGTMVSAYMGIISAIALHNKSFASVLRAPMSFYDTTPIGRIINRFSRDQDVIDSLLMDTLRMMVFMTLVIVATFCMIAVVTPFFLVALAPIMVLYYITQKKYRETSRELKRLESISRSPLFSHFNETLTGLATIRAYRAQKTFTAANVDRVNGNNRSYYLLVLTQRWLSIRVETIGALIAFVAALIVVIQRDSISAGVAGVSLTYAIGITALLNWVVRQTVEAENSMNSVERSKFYTDQIAQEAPTSIPAVDERLDKINWPSQGAIKFEDVKVRYREGLPLVLHGVNLDIKGGERIGIVGRTGAGKSSLMVALFRIVEAASGRILIDGEDISKMGLDKLRSKLAIIPQDPVLYSGTVRSNLDPFDQYSDAELWSVLEKAHLKQTISALELKLMDPVNENGECFSVGQRCQICLARAMLRNAKVLIMDEATASVDMETDSHIQNSLRRNFHCTLLTIAHRLNTIVDYNRVLVLNFGLVQEFDTPANLLRNPHSALSSMVNETGEANAALLRQIAFKAERGERVDIAEALGIGSGLATDDTFGGTAEEGATGSGATTAAEGDAAEPVEHSQVRWHDVAAEEDLTSAEL